jgi:hypothetical protein
MSSLVAPERPPSNAAARDFDPTLPPFRAFAFGAGVQSKTLLYHIVLEEPAQFGDRTWRGFFPGGNPEVILFADTQAEPYAVMDAVDEARIHAEAAGIPFEVVTMGDLAHPPMTSTGVQSIFVPLFTIATEGRWEKKTTTTNPFDVTRWTQLQLLVEKTGDARARAELATIATTDIDVWIPPGELGQLRRQCTGRYKIEIMVERAKQLAGRRPIEMWLGVSMDEIERVKTGPTDRIRYFYPFIFDQRVDSPDAYRDYGHFAPASRHDCLRFLEAIESPPVKSACVFCPYRSEWAWAKMAAEDPESFERACEYDERMRHARPGYECYVHRSRTPLRTVQFEANAPTKLSLFGDTDMSQSGGCEEGYCGL